MKRDDNAAKQPEAEKTRTSRLGLPADGRGRPGGARGSAPLPARAERPRLLAELAGQLDLLEERMGLLWRVARMARLPLAGVQIPFRPNGPVKPNHLKLVQYMVGVLEREPGLDRAVTSALLRYQQAGRHAGWRNMADGDPPTDEALRRALFELSSMFAPFQHDRILAQVFPGTEVRRFDAARMESVRPRPEDVMAARRAAVARATRMVTQLAGPMALLERALQDCERGLHRGLGALFSPEGRTALVVAGELVQEPAALPRARAAHAAFARVKGLVAQADRPDFDHELLKDLLLPLGELIASLRSPPGLRALFNPA